MQLHLPPRSVSVLAECDVLVCGGGPAGIASAVSAARHGCRVVLLEQWPGVGGQATHALVAIWHTSDRTKEVIFGLTRECVQRCGKGIVRFPSFPTTPETYRFDPERMRIVFHDLLEDAGVRVFCHLPAGQPLLEEGRIRGVLAETKTGTKAVTAKIVVDATGDGDVAAKAGLPFEFGRDADGLVQGMTMMYRVCGVDDARLQAMDSEREADVVRRMCELRDRGEFPRFNEQAMRFREWFHNRCTPNMCPVSGNPLDEEELTRLSARARRQVYRYIDFWRRELPGFEDAEVEQTACMLGVRESRRITGIKTLDRHMVVNAVKQPDAIGHGFWLVDIHDPKGTGHTTWSDDDPRDRPPAGESYHIPLGICLNDRIPNLAVAGRCASATHEGQASMRIQSHCMIMGQGVGTAAALALEAGVELPAVDTENLQRVLREDGVYIEDVPNVAMTEESPKRMDSPAR